MRDIAVLIFTGGGAFLGLTRPWMGVLALAVMAYMNPHRYAWGFSKTLPVYFIIFVATCFGAFATKDKQSFPLTRETVLFLFLLAWFTLTTFVAADFPDAAHEQWVKVMKVYLGIFPTFWLINTPRKLKILVMTIALSFGAIGLKGGIFSLGTGFSYRVWGPPGTFYGGNNEIALALNIALPLLVLCATQVQDKKWRWFFYATAFFTGCSIIGSWSRGALVTIIAVMVGLLYRSQRKWLVVPLLAIGLMVAIPNLPDEWFQRMDTIQTYENDASAMGRIEAWGYAWRRALESPLTGGGFETFRGWVRDVHSAYFEILGEHGFIALGLWMTLLFGTMIMLSGLRKRALEVEGMEWIKPYAEALQISLGAYAVGGAFLGCAYWEIFYQLIGICVLMKVFLYREIETQEMSARMSRKLSSMQKEPL